MMWWWWYLLTSAGQTLTAGLTLSTISYQYIGLGLTRRVTVGYFIISKIHCWISFRSPGSCLPWAWGGEVWVVLEYHIDCLEPSRPPWQGAMCCHLPHQPPQVVVLSLLTSEICWPPLNILSHALGSVAPVVTALMLGHGAARQYHGFLQLPGSPHFLSARAMTRLLISIFSPRFITKTRAVSCDLPGPPHCHHKDSQTFTRPLMIVETWDILGVSRQDWTNI